MLSFEMMHRKFRLNLYTGGALASTLSLSVMLLWTGRSGAATAGPTARELERQFASTVRPFMQAYCTDCHGKDKPQAQLNLAGYTTMASVVKDLPHWTLVMERLHAKDMPPADFSKRPTDKQRAAVMAWIAAVRQLEISRTAGDPGPVLARRLSNAEYDYTVRDLTGVDLRPTKEFPVDPANQEGFDNSGESLTFSPALLKKYMAAAKKISDHMALTSTGLAFAAHPVVVETDRNKFCTKRIVAFYKSQPTELADYFYAAWKLKTSGKPLATVATEEKVSAKYLETIWKLLNAPEYKVGPVATLQKKFSALPSDPEAAKNGSRELRDWVVGLRRKISWRFGNLKVPAEFRAGSFTNILWKDRLYAAHRRKFNAKLLQVDGVPASRPAPVKGGSLGQVSEPPKMITDPVDPDLFIPLGEAARAPYQASFEQFSSIFPDAFFIDERGLMESDNIFQRTDRLLTGGTHNATSYFRDDVPLMELVLDAKGQRELDALWRDFAIMAAYNEETYLQGMFYEGLEAQTILAERDPEFNFAKYTDRASASEEFIKRYADLYLAKAKRKGAEPETLAAYEDYFKRASADIRQEERDRVAAEPVHVKALLDFARRAYRRPLTEAERTSLLGFYKTLRQKEGIPHESAIRDCVASILMSPSFLFRLDGDAPAVPAKPATGKILSSSVQAPPSKAKTQPLSDLALASRLSYFIWASLPDDELMALAVKGELHKPEVLAAQARRMLKDPRVQALAVEFGGNWLDFRRFEEHNAVDRERFPSFNDTLRQAMFEEPVHFMMDTFQSNGSVLDWLYAKHTFVNAPLAKHYGMDDIKVEKDAWVKVPSAEKYGRGGLFPMAVFMTKNASGLRTSPVRRGYWVVRRLLGEQIPPPPAVVPELPKDETQMGDKTLREVLAAHRKNPACAGCHARFDSYGLVFEKFGPIGERRTKDGGGKQVDSRAPFPGGKDFEDVAGLQDFLKQRRQKDFLDNFGRKLLSYSLGRTLLPSDEPLLLEMQRRLTNNNYRFNTLVETIVTSPQFRTRRVSVATTTTTKES